MTRQEAITLVDAACRPADLFGDEPSAWSRRYRRLARLLHPDACPGDHQAAAAFAKMADLWRQSGEADLGAPVATGDIANLYPARRGLLKLARHPADNDLMDSEATALTRLRDGADARYRAYLPRLIETARYRDPGSGLVRCGNVLGLLDGFRTLAEVGAAFPDGLDPRDAAWMWRRLLVAIGLAHRAGVVHGAVLPEHVMIHPAEHGLVLVDWCYSVSRPHGGSRPGGRVTAIVARYRDWYPAEVLARQPAGPDTDIYLAARCMTHLMGAQVTRPLTAFAAGCALRDPRRRPCDAWLLLSELDELLERCYGPRAFRPFIIPV